MEETHPTRTPEPGTAPPRQEQPRQPTSLRFGSVAAALSQLARSEGLSSPAFRSPPGLVGVTRSIRRRRDGEATVAVALRSRPWAAVVADMIEGVVAANRLRGVVADRCRARLWAGLGEIGEVGQVGEVGDAGRGRPMGQNPARIRDDRAQTGRQAGKPSNGENARGFAA
jgi:hypothetical protein